MASFTVTKLRWLAQHEPENAAATAAVCLPHDWLTWRLRGGGAWPTWSPTAATPAAPATSPASREYRPDLLERGDRPADRAAAGARRRRGGRGTRRTGQVLGPGAGDNAAAALGLGARPGDVVVSIGTSGVVRR